MKKLLTLTLALCLLLSGCGERSASLPEPGAAPPPPTETAEQIDYELTTVSYDRTVTADDGTQLMQVSFRLPHLNALSDGAVIETPATPAQQAALERAETFNQCFDQWREAGTAEENIASARAHYEADPAWFGTDGALCYAEELNCTAYRLGSLVSVAAAYYSYLGGAHPNTVYFSWNFDLDSGIFLTIPELAADPQAFTLAVADMIEAQVAETLARDGLAISDVYWENYRETLEKWGSDYAASFDAEGLSVIFSAYELAPYAAGEQVFHFPYAALERYWSDSGRAALGLDAA